MNKLEVAVSTAWTVVFIGSAIVGAAVAGFAVGLLSVVALA